VISSQSTVTCGTSGTLLKDSLVEASEILHIWFLERSFGIIDAVLVLVNDISSTFIKFISFTEHEILAWQSSGGRLCPANIILDEKDIFLVGK